MIVADKAYCLKKAQDAMAHRGATSGAILRQNMSKDLDRWRSAIRAPFEGVFSKFEKRARYRGPSKVQFQFFMEAIVHNAKRLVTPKTSIDLKRSSKIEKSKLIYCF
jgi:transposase, IS5 family